MSESRFPETFSSYDKEYGRVMILPHGPDPVLCGIRGETPEAVLAAFSDLLPVKNLLGHMIFRSNQGTGEHLPNRLNLANASAYSSGSVIGTVISDPTIEIGGHVFFRIRNDDGEISCASYEPTADFRKAVAALNRGDVVKVAGGIRKPTSIHPKVLNLELLEPVKLQTASIFINPKCPNCGISLKSKGQNQGFACRKCDYTSRGKRVVVNQKREISRKLYLPPMKAHRHLTRPAHRYLLEPKTFKVPVKLFDGWLR